MSGFADFEKEKLAIDQFLDDSGKSGRRTGQI
jgi:hypothetical protein